MNKMSSFPGNKFANAACDYDSCTEAYNAVIITNPSPDEICPVIIDALDCLDRLTTEPSCSFDDVIVISGIKVTLEATKEKYNCMITPSPSSSSSSSSPSPTPSPTPPPPCPPIPFSPIQNLSTADIVPKSSHSKLCPRYDYGYHNATRHCSVHTYSHILPFCNNSVRCEESVQDFMLPGSYYILNHNQGVKIEIFTAVRDIQSPNLLSVHKVRNQFNTLPLLCDSGYLNQY